MNFDNTHYVNYQNRSNTMNNELTEQDIAKLAATSGCNLKEKPGMSLELNPYVFDFARAIIAADRELRQANTQLADEVASCMTRGLLAQNADIAALKDANATQAMHVATLQQMLKIKLETAQQPLTDEQLRAEFAKLYNQDDALLHLSEHNSSYYLEAIGARHHLAAFKSGARAIEQAHGITIK